MRNLTNGSDIGYVNIPVGMNNQIIKHVRSTILGNRIFFDHLPCCKIILKNLNFFPVFIIRTGPLRTTNRIDMNPVYPVQTILFSLPGKNRTMSGMINFNYFIITSKIKHFLNRIICYSFIRSCWT